MCESREKETNTDGTTQADLPAVVAMVLGLLLDHVSSAAVILVMVTG